ncbi:Pentacotripeptide-repeat region of PRORP domain-containing protein [Plasmodiophora brassicae]
MSRRSSLAARAIGCCGRRPRRSLHTPAPVVTHPVAPPRKLFEAFLVRPTACLAVLSLRQEDDPNRGWAIFERMVESGIDIDEKFFQTMMTFCKQRLPTKAPQVLSAALDRRIPINATLFSKFLWACRKAAPPMLWQALDMYSKCGVRSPDIIFQLANICRMSRCPTTALFLVQDAIENNVDIDLKLMSLFAACCAESLCTRAADTAERLLDLVRSKRIGPYHNHELYCNLLKALVAQDRFDAAVNALDLLDSIGFPPAMQAFTLVLSALAKSGNVQQALTVFRTMVDRGIRVDTPALACLVAACGRAAQLDAVQEIHEYVRDNELVLNDLVVSALISAYANCGDLEAAAGAFAERCTTSDPHGDVFNSMISAYCKHGKVAEARSVFDRLPAPTIESCNAVVSALVKDDRVSEAMPYFRVMTGLSAKPDVPWFVRLINACDRCFEASSATVLYGFAKSSGMVGSDKVASAFIAAYAACCHVDRAYDVFADRCAHSVPGVPVFDSMIAGFAQHGMLDEALDAFNRLKESRVRPTQTTLVGLLTACSNAGADMDHVEALVSEFASTWRINVNHNGHLVELQARAGDLDAAEALARSGDPSLASWMSVLRGCWKHGDEKRAGRCLKRVLALPDDGAARGHMSALTMMLEVVPDTRTSMRKQIERKMADLGQGERRVVLQLPDRSLRVSSADERFCNDPVVLEQHLGLLGRLQGRGHSPDSKTERDLSRIEVVALAHALATLQAERETPVRLSLDTRIRRDTHAVFNLASQAYQRSIYVRDPGRIHRFHQGQCACDDYW